MATKFATAGAIAVMVLNTPAFAATLTKSGEIKSIDPSGHKLVLTTGDMFELGQTVHINRLKVGDKVDVFYKMAGGKEIATRVHAVK